LCVECATCFGWSVRGGSTDEAFEPRDLGFQRRSIVPLHLLGGDGPMLVKVVHLRRDFVEKPGIPFEEIPTAPWRFPDRTARQLDRFEYGLVLRLHRRKPTR